MASISIASLTKVFPVKSRDLLVVDNISLGVQDGEFLCLLGPSGCGKSTLLMCIGGLEHPTTGEILVGDRPVTGPGSDRAIVFQQYALFPWRTVQGNIEFGLELASNKKRGFDSRTVAHRVDSLIDLVGLREFRNSYPHQLSGGMRQRVAIARALAVDPEVLLLDEPFAALDALTRSTMQKEMIRIWQSTRKTVVFVTHNIVESMLMGARIVVFSARPARIREIVEVNLPIPRDTADLRFLAIQKHVEDLVNRELEANADLSPVGSFAAELL